MTRKYAVLLPLVLCLVGVETLAQRPASRPNPLPVVGRSIVATQYGIVAASQPLAARAGVQVLERGGNAIDAAIATNAVSVALSRDRCEPPHSRWTAGMCGLEGIDHVAA